MRSLGHACALLVLTVVLGCQPDVLRPRNLILISVDTLNAGVIVRALREPGTLPNLRRLIDRSVVFSHAFTAAPWTLPAHGSLMTGLYPDRHGAVARERRLGDEVQTLAEVLRAAGFETVAFTGGAFLDADYGFAQGFQRYDGKRLDASYRPALLLPRDGRLPPGDEPALFDRAIALLEQRGQGDPALFLFVHTYQVHDYWKVRPWIRSTHPDHFLTGDYYLACLSGMSECRGEDWMRLRELYSAEIEILDWGLGQLLDTLEQTGLADESLIVLVSDHGEGFEPARTRIHHGGRLDADLIRVPLLVSGPGIVPATRAVPISLVDVMPTVLDRLGLSAPADLDGVSLSDELEGAGQTRRRRVLASEYFYDWQEGRRRVTPEPRTRPVAQAVIRWPLWYVRGTHGERLYDMQSDPDQTADLAAEHEATPRLRLQAMTREGRYAPPASSIVEDEALRTRLESLGYLEVE